MKNLSIIIFICLLAPFLSAQTLEKQQFRLNFLSPGLSYEHSLGSDFTLYGEVGAAINLGYVGGRSYSSFRPMGEVQGRYYYNLKRRERKEKRVANNSGNYIAAFGNARFPSVAGRVKIDETSSRIGVLWGLQRSYQSGISLSFDLGLGYNAKPYEDETTIMPRANFTIGYLLGSRKK